VPYRITNDETNTLTNINETNTTSEDTNNNEDQDLLFFGHKILFLAHSEYFDALFKNLSDFAHFHTKTPLPEIDTDHVMEIPLYSVDSEEFSVLKNFIYYSRVNVGEGDDVLLTLVLANKVCLDSYIP